MNSTALPSSPAEHDAIAAWFAGLQSRIVAGLEDIGGERFLRRALRRLELSSYVCLVLMCA